MRAQQNWVSAIFILFWFQQNYGPFNFTSVTEGVGLLAITSNSSLSFSIWGRKEEKYQGRKGFDRVNWVVGVSKSDLPFTAIREGRNRNWRGGFPAPISCAGQNLPLEVSWYNPPTRHVSHMHPLDPVLLGIYPKEEIQGTQILLTVISVILKHWNDLMFKGKRIKIVDIQWEPSKRFKNNAI